jgi:hypothetical protein
LELLCRKALRGYAMSREERRYRSAGGFRGGPHFIKARGNSFELQILEQLL